MSQLNAARSAGYSETYSKQACRVEKLVKVSLQDAFERAGLTDKVIAEIAMKWINSNDGKAAHSFFRTSLEMLDKIKNPSPASNQTNVYVTPSKTYVFTSDPGETDVRGIFDSESENRIRDTEPTI